jgi:hypothetical protein
MKALLRFIAAISLLTLTWACTQTPITAAAPAAPAAAVKNWYVYRDADSKENHGYFTNVIPAEGAKMLTWNMSDRADPQSGGTCMKVNCKFAAPNWCGLAVSCLPDYFGVKDSPPGTAFNLQGARRLVFWAKGEKGNEYIQVKCAAFGDKPFGDSAKTPIESEWIHLTKGWKEYHIDVSGYDLHRVINPFLFVTDKAHNEDDDITFYVDEIFYELPDDH